MKVLLSDARLVLGTTPVPREVALMRRLIYGLTLVLALIASRSAEAECAWLLWSTQGISFKGGPYHPLAPSLMSAYTSASDCIAKLDSLQSAKDKDLRWAPTAVDRYNNNGERLVHIKWQCLPDTVDLRGPKVR